MAITQDQSWVWKNWNRGLGVEAEIFMVQPIIFVVQEFFLSDHFQL